MDFDAIFAAYYVQYRTEAVTPTSADDEYTIGMALANEAVNRWANYDNTYWKELFTTLQISGDGDNLLASGTTEYETPEDMREAGGSIRVFDSTGATQLWIPIIEPQDAQFRSDNSNYAYFIGDPNNGYTLNLNPVPVDRLIGMGFDYVYYKKPTIFATGTDLTEMSEPYFIVHRMLANRFRGSRNPYYASAKTDAEDVLRTMQLENNSGTWADPWKLSDNSGAPNFGGSM